MGRTFRTYNKDNEYKNIKKAREASNRRHEDRLHSREISTNVEEEAAPLYIPKYRKPKK